MGVRDSIRAYNGVINWCNNNNINLGRPKKGTYRAADQHLNNIFREFGKAHAIKMCKNNSRGYKGTFSPAMANCVRIQENWELFKTWIQENYGVDK